MDDEELQHLLSLRRATLARIRVLEQRKAERGELETGQAVELQQARVDIQTLDARLQAPTPSRAVSDLIPDAPMLHLQLQFASFVARFDDAMVYVTQRMEEMQGKVEDLQDHNKRESEARAEGQARNFREKRRIWLSVGLLAVAVLVLTLLVVRWFV